jgi:hypothetical protein
MKFSIGDPVYVKSNQEEGIIEEFIGKDMASIKVGKSSYFVYLEDLDHPYLRWFTDNSRRQTKAKTYIDNVKPEAQVQRNSGLPQGVFLVVFPIYAFEEFDEKIEKVKYYLYNETTADYSCNFNLYIKNELIFSLDFDLLNNQEFYVHDLDFESLASNPSFSFRFVDHLHIEHDNDFQFNIKPKKLFAYIDQIKFDNTPFFTIEIFSVLKPKPKQEVVKSNFRLQPSYANTKKSHFDFQHAFQNSNHEIDLHIEKLVSNPQQLSPTEMLYIQLKECQKALDLANATYQKYLIIIHGIGKGRLKEEIHLLLNQTNFIERYVFEYDPRYGYGATKVYLKH